MVSKTERYACDEANASKIAEWIRTRGGILIWKSINLSLPEASWTGPALDTEGQPSKKPTWAAANEPERHITDINDVDVLTGKEVKRFFVPVRMGSQNLTIKVTDGGTRRIRAEVAKAREKYKKPAWYDWDYGNVVIMVEDERIPLVDWLAKQAAKTRGVYSKERHDSMPML